jgi:hypothetical protein
MPTGFEGQRFGERANEEVIPAKAKNPVRQRPGMLDSRFRGNDKDACDERS